MHLPGERVSLTKTRHNPSRQKRTNARWTIHTLAFKKITFSLLSPPATLRVKLASVGRWTLATRPGFTTVLRHLPVFSPVNIFVAAGPVEDRVVVAFKTALSEIGTCPDHGRWRLLTSAHDPKYLDDAIDHRYRTRGNGGLRAFILGGVAPRTSPAPFTTRSPNKNDLVVFQRVPQATGTPLDYPRGSAGEFWFRLSGRDKLTVAKVKYDFLPRLQENGTKNAFRDGRQNI